MNEIIVDLIIIAKVRLSPISLLLSPISHPAHSEEVDEHGDVERGVVEREVVEREERAASEEINKLLDQRGGGRGGYKGSCGGIGQAGSKGEGSAKG
jgi:hypothetical protein